MKKFNELLQTIKANPNLIKLFNEIRKDGPIRKSMVGLDLHVSKPTRYSLMKELIDENELFIVDGWVLKKGDIYDL